MAAFLELVEVEGRILGSLELQGGADRLGRDPVPVRPLRGVFAGGPRDERLLVQDLRAPANGFPVADVDPVLGLQVVPRTADRVALLE
ncbi:hypothetical protein [Sorangium sp. So ce124]|uniref:hypothetical protein n=1 Tax=Sorangium sp. So ce124 TaxID=3133280 RepID=UPI003F6262F1